MIQYGFSYYRLNAEQDGYEQSPNGKRWVAVRPTDVPIHVRAELRKEARVNA